MSDKRCQAVIESYDGGFLTGWIYNPSAPDESVEFFVELNGQVVTEGVADIYREDLEQAGMGNGKHFFRVAIQRHVFGSEKYTIKLRDADGNDVEGIPLEFELPTPKITAQYLRHDSFNIGLQVNSADYSGPVNLSLFADNEFIHMQSVHVEKGSSQVYVSAPKRFLDNVERLFSVGVEGASQPLWQGYVKFPFITTERQHLRDAHRSGHLIGLAPQSEHRYESLKLWLDEDLSLEQLKNIQTAHSVVVEGWEKRTSYPKLRLPSCDTPKVSIIIPAYNKFAITYHTIASIILSYDKTDYEVIVADDCSTDETTDIESIIENVRVVRNPENLMFLRSCNNAAQHAKGDLLLFLNNDTEVTSYWLKELVHALQSDDVGIAGSKLINADGSLQEAGGIVWDDGTPWNVGYGGNAQAPEYNYKRDVDYVSGAALCIKKSVWDDVGGFSDYLAPAYFEDTDIPFKVRDAGYRVVYVPNSEVYHFEGMSHGKDVTKGVKRFQVVNQKKFAEKWAHALTHNGKDRSKLQLYKDREISHRILVIDYTAPKASDSAGAYAAIQEINLMQQLGFKVTFACDSLAHLGSTTFDLQRRGVECLHTPFYLNLDDVLAKRLDEFDAVYITRYNVAEKCISRIKQLRPQLPVLFNNADLHFLREMRAALGSDANSSEKEKRKALNEAIATRRKELRVCKQSDAILCYNSTEHAVITSHIYESEKLHITPWVLEEKPEGPAREERSGIAFLGGYAHQPNVEAVEYLVKQIMPKLKAKRPDIKLSVYGSAMPDEFKEWEADNIDMVGFAESLDGVFHDHRIFVAPLLSGAGIKGKVLEAMAYKTPTVLTEVAAEGTGLTHSISTLIANNPDEWVEAIIKLYDDEQLWQTFADNSATLVKEKYSLEHGVKRFKDIFASVGVYSRK